ncbi:MAG TPA: hypothetical protein VHD36_04045 [Pirellulales bacterium]|nr:hypothetical protein [Pirellulales bacterium]
MSKRRRTIRIDGVVYQLTVENIGPQTATRWCCERCNCSGKTRLGDGSDRSLSLAMDDIWDHHDYFHAADRDASDCIGIAICA